MSDEKIMDPSLEPIDDEDLDLAKKFGHIEKNGSELLENKKESIIFLSEKEKSKEILNTEKDTTYNKILSKISNDQVDNEDQDIKKEAEIVSKKDDAEGQVQHLVDLAVTRGVVYAVRVAKHLEDNYVLDMLHDKMISEELHKVLLEKKLLTEE